MMNCSFCFNKGIKGPHAHTIRDFTMKGAPIICPELLNINCTYCKEKGHTVNYCDVLKEKKRPSPVDNAKPQIGKRRINIDAEGFVTYKNYDRPIVINICINKVQKVNNLSSMFAALEVEIDQNADAKEENLSWANIVVRRPRKEDVVKKKRWCDYEDDEE